MQTWDELEVAIRAAVDGVLAEEQDFAVLTLTGSDRYVQWISGGRDELRVEVSSNEALGARVVAPASMEKLRAMGVAVDDPDPNYVYEPATADAATALVVRVLREVFEVQPVDVAGIDLG